MPAAGASRAPASAPFDTDVLVVGAGPTGLTLAVALAMQGIRTRVVDRQPAGANTSRAAVVHARTLEVLEPLDVARRLVAEGLPIERFAIRDRDRVLVPLRFGRLPTAYPYTLMISQADTERLLAGRLAELGPRVEWGRALVALQQDAEGVTARFDDGHTLRARWLVGADGMHSVVRERVGIGFVGGTYGESFLLADVRLAGGAPADEVGLYFAPAGMVVVAPLPGGVHRIVATLDAAPEQPTVDDVQRLLDERGPQAARWRVESVLWGSRFRVHHRVADRYRAGRVLLAGDAAHVHSPAGGQGMNAGMLDAVGLAEALGRTLAGGSEGALDDYGRVRRPIALQIVALADRLTRLATVRPALRGLRNGLLTAVFRLPALRRRLAWRLSGLVYR